MDLPEEVLRIIALYNQGIVSIHTMERMLYAAGLLELLDMDWENWQAVIGAYHTLYPN